jgi:hypothetical protein
MLHDLYFGESRAKVVATVMRCLCCRIDACEECWDKLHVSHSRIPYQVDSHILFQRATSNTLNTLNSCISWCICPFHLVLPSRISLGNRMCTMYDLLSIFYWHLQVVRGSHDLGCNFLDHVNDASSLDHQRKFQMFDRWNTLSASTFSRYQRDWKV